MVNTDEIQAVDFHWHGDLKDDCTAIGHGFMLRAEQMTKNIWWWAVYDNEGGDGSEQIAASYDRRDNHARTGREARILAERAVWRHLANLGAL